MTPVIKISWLADWQALSLLLCPRYWEDTTAPPVATAAKILMNRVLTISTRETPEVAASPAFDTIMVSTIPTDTASICSTIRGSIRRFKSWLVNIRTPAPFCSILHIPSFVSRSSSHGTMGDVFLKKPTPPAIPRQSVIYPKISDNQTVSPAAFHKSPGFLKLQPVKQGRSRPQRQTCQIPDSEHHNPSQQKSP